MAGIMLSRVSSSLTHTLCVLLQLECFKKRKGKVSCKENLSTDGIQIHKGFKFKLSKEKVDDKANANAAAVIFNAWGMEHI